MAYDFPKCACGNDLICARHVVYEESFKINKDGRIRDKKCGLLRTVNDDLGEWLECAECGNEYDFDYDNKLRVIVLNRLD